MKGQVAFVASPGGHIDEAFEIAHRFASRVERWWITARTSQTETLLSGERAEWVPLVSARQAGRAAASLGRALRLLRARRPRLLVSTGAALTVPYMLAARSLGIPVTYVESATRLTGPSQTGRIAQIVRGIDLRHQSAHWRPRGWAPEPSVFDEFAVEDVPRRPLSRVLVTLGTEQFPFPRALDAARPALDGMDVAWQTGHTPGLRLAGDARPWWSAADLGERARTSDAIITHAGVGSILMALRAGICPVVIPRLHSRAEHVDDHQLELAAALHARRLVVLAAPGDELAGALATATARRVSRAPDPAPEVEDESHQQNTHE